MFQLIVFSNHRHQMKLSHELILLTRTKLYVGFDNILAYFPKMAAPNIAPYMCFLIDYAYFKGNFSR